MLVRSPARPGRPWFGLSSVAVLLACAIGTATPANATELIFEPTNVNFQPVDQAYGDRVVATAQDGFLYGAAGGATPNVTVSYGPPENTVPEQWTVGYGDLAGVLFDDQDSWGRLEIALATDAGWLVSLSGFDMAAWRVGGAIRSLRVWNGAGELLFDESDVDIPSTGHVHFGFDPPLTARWLTIGFDAGNLGGLSDNIGIDNIEFSQVESPTAVEPGTWARTKAEYR